MINWQPMHTAPSDDRWVLIFDENAPKLPFKLAKRSGDCGWRNPHTGFIMYPKYWAEVNFPEPYFRTKMRRKK